MQRIIILPTVSSSMAQPCPKPHHLNKSTVTSSTAEPVLNAPMLSATTRSKPCPKPCRLNTSGGASSVAEPVPNTLQPSTSTLVTQPKPHPQKHHPLNQSGVPSTNPVDGGACDSKNNDSDDFSLFLMYMALFWRSQILLQSHLSLKHP